jgi:hypothetical protein
LYKSINTFLTERLELGKFAIINLMNGLKEETDKEGLLILTMIDHYTGAKLNGTVCADNFDGLSAHFICHSMGYASAMLERYGAKINNFAKLVYLISNARNFRSELLGQTF